MSSIKYKNLTAYQDTPIGTIPADWEVKKLGEIIKGKGEYGINAPAVPYDKNLPKYIRITDIDDEGNFSTEKITSVICETASDYSLKEGDILFVRTGATTGKAYLYKKDDGELVFAGFLIRFKIDDKIADKYFVWSYTKTTKYENWVRKVSQRSGQPGLNSNEYSSLLLPLPPLSEQKRIAEVLSTWDQAIQCTEQLIRQKEQRKKWLMQKLLTGKIRLKGFSGEWKEYKLGDLFERTIRKNSEGNTNVVTISAQRGFVKQTDFFNKSVASNILDNYFLIYKGEFCYNKSYSNGYPWGATKRLNIFDKAVVTTLYICFGIKDYRLANSDYFEQYFEANLLDKGLTQIAHEGGRAHGLLNVTPSDFFSLKVKIPDYKEQTAIAEVLQAADEEIELLKAKAEKLKEQKKGLMQQLLTGRKRLNLN